MYSSDEDKKMKNFDIDSDKLEEAIASSIKKLHKELEEAHYTFKEIADEEILKAFEESLEVYFERSKGIILKLQDNTEKVAEAKLQDNLLTLNIARLNRFTVCADSGGHIGKIMNDLTGKFKEIAEILEERPNNDSSRDILLTEFDMINSSIRSAFEYMLVKGKLFDDRSVSSKNK